jgi:hypothetical protein
MYGHTSVNTRLTEHFRAHIDLTEACRHRDYRRGGHLKVHGYHFRLKLFSPFRCSTHDCAERVREWGEMEDRGEGRGEN